METGQGFFSFFNACVGVCLCVCVCVRAPAQCVEPFALFYFNLFFWTQPVQLCVSS